MTGKISRKGKNPGPVDAWLDALGYYRKNVAYDETCLFRAIAEQLFSCQLFHEKVRIDCIEYAMENHYEFQHLIPVHADWEKHLDKLRKHMAICGPIEIEIICKKYKKNVIVFDSIKQRVERNMCDEYDETLLLCLMTEEHYDVVYKKDYIATAGLCQSIAYNILYENVFQIPQIPEIVQAMLYDKPPFLSSNGECSQSDMQENTTTADTPVKPENMTDYEFMLKTNLAPFPFKVAKALDPSIYRNIEYDTWTEIRKEMRLGDWYYGDNNLILGTRCILLDKGEALECYIQDILKGSKECVVYITNKAEKRTVNYSDLSPEYDAKPWPLPYRFSKNLLACNQPPMDKEKKPIKKRKDKKRSPSKSSNSSVKDSPSHTNNNLTLDINDNITAFEGCPLQMQQVERVNSYEQEQTVPMESSACYTPNEAGAVQWPGAWDQNAVQTPDSILWTHPPTTPQATYMYAPRGMVSSTPDAYPEPCYYYDSNYQYGMWNGREYMNTTQDHGMPSSPSSDVPMSPDAQQGYVYYPESAYPTAPTIPSPKVCIMPSNSPQIEINFQRMYSQPATPIIYATPTEMDISAIPPPPQPISLFTPPPIEFIPPSPYCVIPSTPPAAWYPPGINAQGFIFPTPSIPNQNVPAAHI